MINIKNLSVKNNDNILIKGLNLKINQGEFWAILGKNGTGKTTLLHTLAGFLKYSVGSIQVDGQDLNNLNILSRAQEISYLPQLLESSLNCTVKQAISYGRYPWHKIIKNSAEDCIHIETAIKRMNLNAIENKSIQEISGGELRKVEIATVLAQDSKIMMLDEPLNHLDMSYRFILMKLLKKLSQNKTIIIITHDIQYVNEYCTHALLLLDKCQPIFGKTSDIMTHKNLTKMLGFSLPSNFMEKVL